MNFVKISGAMLRSLVEESEIADLRAAGVSDESEIRINPQGDIEVHKDGSWKIIGGLLGDYQARIKRLTGLDWS